MSSRLCCGAIALLSGICLYAQSVSAQEQALTLGAYHARGDYGEVVDTKINYLPVSYEYSHGNWSWQATLPYLQVTGLGNVLVNVGGVTQAVAGNEVTRERGLGDAVVTTIYHLAPLGGIYLDLRLDLKLPTADEKRALGTGEIDVSGQLDISANVGTAAVFASLGYNARGRTDLYPGLRNSFLTQLGFARPISDRFSIGVFHDYRQAASRDSPESHELAPYFSYQFSESWSFTGLAVFGLTEASADQAVMGQLRYSW